MLKKTIKYTDYNGEQREEDFYFNLTKPEIIELEVGDGGSLTDYINNIVRSKDAKEVFGIFKKLIAKSYGIKSPDGRRFIKSEEVSKAFFETEAYVELYMELLEDPVKAAEFVKQILPPDMRGETIHVANNN
jgi:hypothetical protein